MKSTFLLLVIFVAAGLSLSAQNCKFEKNEVDKFTKTEVKLTKPILAYSKTVAGGLGGTDMLNLQAEKNGESYALLIKYIYTSKTAVFTNTSEGTSAEAEAKIMFLLENDSIITGTSLNTAQSASSKTSAVNHIDMKFQLTKEDMQQLKSHTIKTIRICKSNDVSQVMVEGEVKPKYSSEISRVIGCVVE